MATHVLGTSNFYQKVVNVRSWRCYHCTNGDGDGDGNGNGNGNYNCNDDDVGHNVLTVLCAQWCRIKRTVNMWSTMNINCLWRCESSYS